MARYKVLMDSFVHNRRLWRADVFDAWANNCIVCDGQAGGDSLAATPARDDQIPTQPPELGWRLRTTHSRPLDYVWKLAKVSGYCDINVPL